jgi:hypothetical protein
MATPIDEQELRSRLAETAALAGPPRFTTEDLAANVRRARRRRGRRRAGFIAAVAVAVVASAAAIPLLRGGTNQLVVSQPSPPAPGLSYTVTANGQARSVPASAGALPLFTITPGERLTVTVEVRVPGPEPMTDLWLGITNGVLSSHANMEPVLAASTRGPLRPGAHRFVLHWAIPAGLRPGSSRQLSVEWLWAGPEPGRAEREVAVFAAPLPARAASPAAVAGRLRILALHAVAICGGGGPAWIRAVRTTYSQATALAGAGNEIADQATAAVYLVLMKGDFILASGRAGPSCGQAPAGHYFWAIVDAATLTTLEASLGNRPPPAPLQTLGPVLDLT